MNKLKVKSKHLVLGLLMVVFGSYSTMANNIQLSNVSLQSQNTSQHSYLVKFDLSWDNSWASASPYNIHDAAWIFIKYRLASESIWHHATLHWVDGTGTADGHTIPTGAAINSTNDNAAGGAHGVFVSHSSAMTQGSVTYNAMELRWDYGADGVSDNAPIEISVYGVEMVYVPQGAFYLGTSDPYNSSDDGSFYALDQSVEVPYLVSNENSINMFTTPGSLKYRDFFNSFLVITTHFGDETGTLASSFPKGYNAFYCMKYEISQQQYVDFLNNMGFPNNRFSSLNTGNNRYGISLNSSTGEYESSNPFVACGFLSGDDILSYLDWAALRPMTELEFEKTTRGGFFPVMDEYAWGSNLKASTAYSLSNSGATNEGISTNYSTSNGNAIYNLTSSSIGGPVRCGLFAANASNNGRVSSGATYYGIMEMSGNIAEFTVSVGDSDSRSFDGAHGDGNLSIAGKSNVSSWPNQRLVYRGGSFSSNYKFLQVVNRNSAENLGATDYTARVNNLGGRGVRTAP